MNTTVCCPLPAGPTTHPWWHELWVDFRADLRADLRAWQASRMERLTLRALQGLSQHTLRDLGMAERLPHKPTTLGLMEYERARWS